MKNIKISFPMIGAAMVLAALIYGFLSKPNETKETFFIMLAIIGFITALILIVKLIKRRKKKKNDLLN